MKVILYELAGTGGRVDMSLRMCARGLEFEPLVGKMLVWVDKLPLTCSCGRHTKVVRKNGTDASLALGG